MDGSFDHLLSVYVKMLPRLEVSLAQNLSQEGAFQ